ncbi:MAG: helix-turn-helix domain-containing protein [Gammaproteobacteria bacterium]
MAELLSRSTGQIPVLGPVLKHPDLLYVVNRLGLLMAALMAIGTILHSSGIISLSVWDSYLDAATPAISPLMLFFLLVLAVLNFQNILYLYLSRERLNLIYCFYIFSVSLSLVFYSGIPTSLGLWTDGFSQFVVSSMAMTFGFSYLLVFSHELLGEVSSKWLGIIRALAMAILFLPLFQFLDPPRIYGYAEMVAVTLMGLLLFIACTEPTARKRWPVLLFLLAFGIHFITYHWSLIIIVWPEWFSGLGSMFADPELTARLIWTAGLIIEASLMSAVIHLQISQLRREKAMVGQKLNSMEKSMDRFKSEVTSGERLKLRQGAKSKPASAQTSLREEVQALIENNINNPLLDVDFLAKTMAMSRATLLRRLKTETDMSPNLLIRNIRLEHARRMLENREVSSVSQAANRCGFLSHGHFSKHFREKYGCSPSQLIGKNPKPIN